MMRVLGVRALAGWHRTIDCRRETYGSGLCRLQVSESPLIRDAIHDSAGGRAIRSATHDQDCTPEHV
jgi:hypothetical protein